MHARVKKLNIVALVGKSFDRSTLTFTSVKQWIIERTPRTRVNHRNSSHPTSTNNVADVIPIVESHQSLINQVINNINNDI